jgi:uridylate kinase
MKKRILLKLTGNTFLNSNRELDSSLIRSIAKQIKSLHDYHFSIVVGAGNFFRGTQHGRQMDLSESQAHQIGMIATGLNGLIVQDIFAQEGLKNSILTAFDCPAIGQSISPHTISNAETSEEIIIFVGGTGSPYFSTDTAAIVRGLQIGVDQVWKATDVDGVYDKDPNQFPDAHLIHELTYEQAYTENIHIMDTTAFTLAQEHNLPIRIFNLFMPNAIIQVACDNRIGSIIR